MEALLLAAALVLAFANGANDNPKGIATLYGSAQLRYRPALLLATGAQIAGSLASVALAGALVTAFSGKGLVPSDLLSGELLCSVAFAAAATVSLATWLGLPISTTHAIVGALVGGGAVAAGPTLDLSALGNAFLLPLLLGPLLAVALAFVFVRSGGSLGAALGRGRARFRRSDEMGVAGFAIDAMLRSGHLLSATAVCFARGLNDTPKIVGLLVGASVVAPATGALLIGAAMALGGWLAARRVADTLALRITPIENGQGLAGNLATSLLVVAASRFGLPVSTTHVSTGGIFGIGASGGTLEGRAAGGILAAWLATLPLAAALAALLAWLVV